MNDLLPGPEKPRKNTAAITCWVLAAAVLLLSLPGLPSALREHAEQGKHWTEVAGYAAGWFIPAAVLAVVGYVLYKRPKRG
jgi:hypothetical protein